MAVHLNVVSPAMSQGHDWLIGRASAGGFAAAHSQQLAAAVMHSALNFTSGCQRCTQGTRPSKSTCICDLECHPTHAPLWTYMPLMSHSCINNIRSVVDCLEPCHLHPAAVKYSYSNTHTHAHLPCTIHVPASAVTTTRTTLVDAVCLHLHCMPS